MRIEEIIWLEEFAEKVFQKHGVMMDEVKDVLCSRPLFRRLERGRVKGEDLYVAYGETPEGRYLFTVFVHKPPYRALVISARDMTDRERRYYHGKKKRT